MRDVRLRPLASLLALGAGVAACVVTLLLARDALAACQATYTVRAGDTLYGIATRSRTSVSELVRVNRLDPKAILPIGAVLRLHRGCTTTRAAAPTSPAAPASAAPATLHEATLARAIAKASRVRGVARGATGIAVLDLAANRLVYTSNPDASLRPASTEKLPVALSALRRLGPTFRIRTTVGADGVIAAGTLRGNLVLKGYGDPTLTRRGLRGLARKVRARGITRVTGNVVGDESYFDGIRVGPGWKPSFYLDESPALSALIVDRGALDGRASEQPALAAARLFVRELGAAGVIIDGVPTVGRARGPVTPLGLVRSPRLTTLLAQMDAWSDNFIAELLLKQLGARSGRGGSSAAGAAVVGSTLAAEAIPRAGVRLADGSGLSSIDRLTARALVGVLETIWHSDELRQAVLPTLAVAGSTGTLRRRLLDEPRHALVRGKTGTTDESSALAGFVGSRFAFAIVSNGFPVGYWAAHTLQDRVVRVLLAALEP
jgi:D-alanyl-D-alanine carboxypeptidase/D-alanyl-D-alanine-endopeptidase (penicillin-binding protein 4)